MMPSRLQDALLDMLAWFHGYCERNHLTYYVIAGTMLGAVRHQGFIPWDDDVDVGLPRPDYQRLIDLMQQDPQGRYRLETPDSPADDFIFPYSKLYDTQTTLLEKSQIPCRRGLYIDVFPIDGVGNTMNEGIACLSPILRLNNIRNLKNCVARPQRCVIKNIVIAVGSRVPNWLINPKKLSRKIARMWKPGFYETSDYVAIAVGRYGTRDIVPKEYYGKPTRYAFESIWVYGPERADAYLSHIYGDWHKLPPENMREGSQHDYIEISLDHSYLD